MSGEKHPRWNKDRAKCIDCGKLFSKATYPAKRCQSCSNKYKRGELSPHWKDGKPKCPFCGKQMSDYHVKWCWDCRKKIRAEASIKTISQRIRSSTEYLKWRKQVLNRDNYRCQMCGSEKNLEIDHIVPFSFLIEHKKENLLFKIGNGRTLCHECHKKHTDYGKRFI